MEWSFIEINFLSGFYTLVGILFTKYYLCAKEIKLGKFQILKNKQTRGKK
jgi:hypothetical protein